MLRSLSQIDIGKYYYSICLKSLSKDRLRHIFKKILGRMLRFWWKSGPRFWCSRTVHFKLCRSAWSQVLWISLSVGCQCLGQRCSTRSFEVVPETDDQFL